MKMIQRPPIMKSVLPSGPGTSSFCTVFFSKLNASTLKLSNYIKKQKSTTNYSQSLLKMKKVDKFYFKD